MNIENVKSIIEHSLIGIVVAATAALAFADKSGWTGILLIACATLIALGALAAATVRYWADEMTHRQRLRLFAKEESRASDYDGEDEGEYDEESEF